MILAHSTCAAQPLALLRRCSPTPMKIIDFVHAKVPLKVNLEQNSLQGVIEMEGRG